MTLYGGIETGGTKINCMIASGPEDIRAFETIPTTTPDQTLERVIEFFEQQRARGLAPAGIGLGAFGPVDLDPDSSTFGAITSTPKPGWRDTPLLQILQNAINLPFVFDLDVAAAAVGELTWGAARGLSTFIYLTIGTGIGGGVIVDGKPLHGLVHPELGHIPLRRDPAYDPYSGFCPYHGDCLEGLAAGPAIERRWGKRAEFLPPDHPAWVLEADYLGQALWSYIVCFSPQRIILGGGVMSQPALFPLVRTRTVELLNGYVQSPAILENPDAYIVPPGLGGRAGIIGCVALAKRAFDPTA